MGIPINNCSSFAVRVVEESVNFEICLYTLSFE